MDIRIFHSFTIQLLNNKTNGEQVGEEDICFLTVNLYLKEHGTATGKPIISLKILTTSLLGCHPDPLALGLSGALTWKIYTYQIFGPLSHLLADSIESGCIS